MTPSEYYQQQLDSGLIHPDSQQKEVNESLNKIHHELIQREKGGQSLLARLTAKWHHRKPVNGLYVWGSVGVGKTLLIDAFYSCTPVPKLRMHFHAFIQMIHEKMRALEGHENPLILVATEIAKTAHLICFDEFFVSDIADAMILAGLFGALFTEGVCLVATSNIKPDDLYKEGLQRDRFLPAIELIKQNTTVFHMASHHDYRLDHDTQANAYFSPLGIDAEKQLQLVFNHLTQDQAQQSTKFSLLGRSVSSRRRTESTIWFDFNVICGVPRSQRDYLALSKLYHTIFVSNIPIIKSHQDNLITAFINLIDVFYDTHRRLVISAETEIEQLYPAGKLRFAFARTQSRITEMQSLDYFNQIEN
jgi:cell division protein ZapE